MGGRRHSAARLVGLAIVSFAALLFLHGEHVHHELHGTVFDAGGKMDKSGWLSDAGGAGIHEGGGRPLANDLKQLGQDGNDQGIGPATTPSTRTNAEEAQSRAAPTDGAEQAAPQSRPRLPTDGAELALLVLCMPSPVDPRGRAGRIDVIETTWAPDVRRRGGDVRYGVPLGGAVPAQHADKYLAPVGVPNGTDTADKFAEMRGLLAAALQAHPTGLRWLFYCNDHTFVLPANLWCYLSELDAATPVYAGHVMVSAKQEPFNSGAAGFALSRPALRSAMDRFSARAAARNDPCVPTHKFERKNPGLVLARCLSALGVAPTPARRGGGRWLLNAYGPVRLVGGTTDDWYAKRHANASSEVVGGRGCCATDVATFHYCDAAEQAILWQWLADPVGRSAAKALDDAARAAAWPAAKALGTYSYRPKSDPAASETWRYLLEDVVVRDEVCSEVWDG